MATELTLKRLQEAVASGAAALRCRRTLQPGGGPGTKVFPPTYAGATYAEEQRRMPRDDDPQQQESVPCVLLDSVQSQANRMEEALQEVWDEGRLSLPVIQVDFGPFYEEGATPEDVASDELKLLEPIGRITSLQAPHRLADAILRDSVVAETGEAFRQSEAGRAIDRASMRYATPLYKLCPTALTFGMWDSTGPKGGLGAKFERAIVSEVVGINAEIGCKTSSRIDPLQIESGAGPLYHAASPNGTEWTVDADLAKKEKNKPALFNRGGTAGKPGNPSKANHGNVQPTITETGGVTIDYAEQTTTLSLICLRRLKFPLEGNSSSREADDAGRTVLAALGLCAATLAGEKGLDLRSRCLLWPEGPMEWELLEKPGEEPERFTLSAEGAINLLKEAVTAAGQADLEWQEQPVRLRPSEELVKLVHYSQIQIARGEAEDAAEEGS